MQFMYILGKQFTGSQFIMCSVDVTGADPQKQYADAVIEVLPTQLIPGDNEGKVLRVRLIMKEGVKFFSPVYLFDDGSTISWIPCGRKLTCSYPGIKFLYCPETYFGHEVIVLNLLNIVQFNIQIVFDKQYRLRNKCKSDKIEIKQCELYDKNNFMVLSISECAAWKISFNLNCLEWLHNYSTSHFFSLWV